MENTKVTLGYWKIRGLASPIRYLLEYCNVQYEEHQYVQGDAPEFSRDDWLNKKMTLNLDFPNLPYLIDGKLRFTESQAIMRYVCNKWNPELLGKTLEDKAHVDMLTGVVKDVYGPVISHCYGTGDKQKLVEGAFSALPGLVKYLGSKKFLVGDYVTFVDFCFYEFLELVDFVSEGRVYGENPSLKAYKENIEKLEKMQEHIKSDRYLKRPFNNKVAKINN